MSLKESNEITVKIKGSITEFYKIVEEKGFRIIDQFSMDDTYFVPISLDIKNLTTREILSKAILVRNIYDKTSEEMKKKITFKIKDFDKEGNILSQEAISCDVLNTDDAMRLLQVIGYKKIMNIKEDDIVYEKDGFELAIKDIKNGEKLIEIETEANEELNTIDKLISKIDKIDIPIYKDNYFVKKAEIELNKILKR